MSQTRRPRDDLGSRLTQFDRILGVHVTNQPADGLDLIIYHRGPVRPDIHLAICEIFVAYSGGADPTGTKPQQLRARNRPPALDWAYRDLDQMHQLAGRVANGHHRFEFDPGQVHLLPDFQPLADLSFGRIVADPSGELTLLHRRLQHYPTPLAATLVARLWQIRPLLDETSQAADRGDTTGTAAGLARAADLAAHSLYGHEHSWPPHPTQLLGGTERLPCAPPGFAALLHRTLAHLGTRPNQLRDAVATTSQLLDGVVAACRPTRMD